MVHPNPVSLWKEDIWTQTRTEGECPVKMKAETGVMRLQAKDGQQTTRSWERGIGQIPSQPSEGTNPASVLIVDV